MKILSIRLVKKIRRPLSMAPEAKATGRPCDKCGTVVPYGSSMHSVSAKDGCFKSTEYLCSKCYEPGKEAEAVVEIWQKRDEERERLNT